MIGDFFGNRAVVDTLEAMIRQDRIHQAILFSGPEGIGKATLARRLAAALLGGADRIARDDLSLPENTAIIAEREKVSAEKRNEEPLFFSSHPDFLTFPPDGPLRQISIPQMRLLKDRARFQPLRGRWRVFLIDQIDRANEQAANSLLKTLEEPPPYLILVMTAANAYDLLPTIRSRAVQFRLAPLSEAAMLEFVRSRGLDQPARRVALAAGSPGVAAGLNLEAYDNQRTVMLALLEAASGRSGLAPWARHSEALGSSRSERLEPYLKVLFLLLEDLLALREGGRVLRNSDIGPQLAAVADRVSFEWIRKAVGLADQFALLLRRNIQRSIALDAMVLELRRAAL